MKAKCAVFTVFVTLISLLTLLGDGYAKQQRGAENACLNVLKGTLVTLRGTVVDIGPHGNGLVLNTGNEEVVVFGLGPLGYWEKNEVDRPEVGEAITVLAYALSFSETTRYIAASITIDEGTTAEETITLRDPDTGCPLWRRGPKH